MSKPVTLYLVRHGQATGSIEDDPDPGLNDLGRAQAEAAARELAPLGPMPLITSPMRRTRETADAFLKHWGGEARVEPRVSEIGFPTTKLEERRAWLMEIMAGRWSDPAAQSTPGVDLNAWRAGVIDALKEIPESSVITSHFVAINVVVGHLLGDDLVVKFRPDNCSVTIVERVGDELRLVEMGREAETVIQ